MAEALRRTRKGFPALEALEQTRECLASVTRMAPGESRKNLIGFFVKVDYPTDHGVSVASLRLVYGSK